MLRHESTLFKASQFKKKKKTVKKLVQHPKDIKNVLVPVISEICAYLTISSGAIPVLKYPTS